MTEQLQVAGAHFQNSFLAKGTARSDILAVLGLDSSEKVLITATASPENVVKIMKLLEQDFDFGKGGGVAFTLPLSAVSGPATLMILSGGNIK